MADILDIEINIGANTEDLSAELQKAENLLSKLQAKLKRSTDVGEIQKLNTKIASVEGSIGTLSSRINGVAKPTNDATNALSNLSRVAQDAPYGFIGIANNLNPLLESFQRLQTKSGSATEALKSMAAGLVGPAGIGLALGVVSSLAVTFSDEIAAFFIGPTEKLKKFREELNKLNQDIYKIVGEAQSNRTVGLNLVNIIAGGDVKRQEEALKRLKSLYSDNAAIQAATIKTDKAYLTHLVNVAAIQQDAAGKEKNTQQILSAAYAERRKIEAQRDQDLKNAKTSFGGSAGYNENKAKEERKRINNQYAGLLASLDVTIANAKTKNAELLNTLTNIETPDSKGGDKKDKKDPFVEITKDFDKSLKAQEVLRSKGIIDQQTYLDNVYKIYEDYIKKLAELDTTQATNKIENLLPKFDKMTLDKNAQIIKNGIKNMLDSYEEPKMVAPEDKYPESQKRLEEARNKYGTFFLGISEKKVEKKNEKEKKDIEDLTRAYEDFGYTISSTVTSALFGMYDAMQQGQSATQALGDMFTRLLRQMAEMVVQAAIFAGIMSLLGGGAAGGGKGFFDIFKGLLGLADGGIATGPTLAVIGEGAESEAVLPLSKLGNIMQSSFNAGSMNSTSGGQNGQFVLRGQDLVLAMQRSNSALNLRRGV
jgi:hypothetical protein